MRFEDGELIVYVKDNSYNKEFDNNAPPFYINGFIYYKGYLVHREDGPAIERPNGSKSWIINGRHHRVDGPSVEWTDGSKAYYLNEIYYSEKEYWKAINIKKRKEILKNILLD